MGSGCNAAQSGLQRSLGHQALPEFCWQCESTACINTEHSHISRSNGSHMTGTKSAASQAAAYNEAEAVASSMHGRSFRQSKAAAAQTAAVREKMKNISAQVEIIGVSNTDKVVRPTSLSIPRCTEEQGRHSMPSMLHMPPVPSTPQSRRQLMPWTIRRDVCSPIAAISTQDSPRARIAPAESNKTGKNEWNNLSARYAGGAAGLAEQPLLPQNSQAQLKTTDRDHWNDLRAQYASRSAGSAEQPLMPQNSKAAVNEQVLTAAAAILEKSPTNATSGEDDNDKDDPLYIPDSDDDILIISEEKRDDFSEEEIEESRAPQLHSNRINKSHMKHSIKM